MVRIIIAVPTVRLFVATWNILSEKCKLCCLGCPPNEGNFNVSLKIVPLFSDMSSYLVMSTTGFKDLQVLDVQIYGISQLARFLKSTDVLGSVARHLTWLASGSLFVTGVGRGVIGSGTTETNSLRSQARTQPNCYTMFAMRVLYPSRTGNILRADHNLLCKPLSVSTGIDYPLFRVSIPSD